MSYSDELAGLREALELPTVGRLRDTGDLDRLRQLVEQYQPEAQQMYGEIHDPS